MNQFDPKSLFTGADLAEKKSFEDGENVFYFNPNHKWHRMMFKAYKSQYTPDAYRLKFGEREVLADISEIRSMAENNEEAKFELDSYSMDSKIKPGCDDYQVSLEYAQGSQLDKFGDFLGMPRHEIDELIETDVAYRDRMRPVLEKLEEAALKNLQNFGPYPDDKL
jgi:hypothetical protein